MVEIRYSQKAHFILSSGSDRLKRNVSKVLKGVRSAGLTAPEVHRFAKTGALKKYYVAPVGRDFRLIMRQPDRTSVEVVDLIANSKPRETAK